MLSRLIPRLLCGVLLLPAAAFGRDGDARGEKPDKPALNSIAGKVLAVDGDARLIRITTEQGYNVEFNYSRQTALKGYEEPMDISDLPLDETVIVRYSGKELAAMEIEKQGAAARVAASTPTSPNN